MPASAVPSTCSATDDARCLTTASAVLFLGSGMTGLVFCMGLTGGTDSTLSWILLGQACFVFVGWPGLHRGLSVTAAPLALMSLSAPMYVLGAVLGGVGPAQLGMTLILLYMIFLYAAFMLKLETMRGAPAGGWYVPVSGLLVAGPVILYYVLAEFLKRPVSWIAGISPVIALSDPAFLNMGCAAWAGVLIVLIAAGALSGRCGEEE